MVPEPGVVDRLHCEEVLRQLWDYLDHELSPELMTAMSSHLAECTRCFPHYHFERAFARALRELQSGHHHPTALRARLQAILEWAGYNSETGSRSRTIRTRRS